MSNFPFNNDKYKEADEVNGSPLNIHEARSLAYKILFWHTNNRTGDFSESEDGFNDSVEDLSYGLLELLSDPNAIKRLMTTGREVEKTIDLLFESKNVERWEKKVKPVIVKIFE